MLKNVIQAAVLLSATGFVGHDAMAAVNTSDFEAKIVITSTCDVTTVAPSDMDFGTVAAGETDVDATSTITVTCSKGTSYTIGLTPGSGSTDGTGTMAAQNVAPTTGNTDAVPYALFSDFSHSTAWGNQSGNVVGGVGEGLSVATDTYKVYGLVEDTDYTPDTYLDTVTVTLTY